MAVSNLLTTLIEGLLELTTDGQVEWEETADENVFLASVSQYVVTIGRSRNPEDYDSWRYVMRVSDRQGKLVEETTSSDSFSRTAEGVDPHTDLVPLFEAARRKALNADQALIELNSLIDSMRRSRQR